jgi:hypothetical protein
MFSLIFHQIKLMMNDRKNSMGRVRVGERISLGLVKGSPYVPDNGFVDMLFHHSSPKQHEESAEELCLHHSSHFVSMSRGGSSLA